MDNSEKLGLDSPSGDDGKPGPPKARRYKTPRYTRRPCALCRSEQRDVIEAAFLTGRHSVPMLAELAGVHLRAAERHFATHLPARLAHGRELREQHFTDALWDRLFRHEAEIVTHITRAAASEHATVQGTLPTLHRELTAIHRLQAEIRGLVRASASASVTVHNSASPDPQVWKFGDAELQFMPDGRVRMFAIPIRPHQLSAAMRGELPGQRNGGDADDIRA
jgi:hypothetical protein